MICTGVTLCLTEDGLRKGPVGTWIGGKGAKVAGGSTAGGSGAVGDVGSVGTLSGVCIGCRCGSSCCRPGNLWAGCGNCEVLVGSAGGKGGRGGRGSVEGDETIGWVLAPAR